MKRSFLVLLMAFGISALVSAQPRNWGRRFFPGAPSAPQGVNVTVNGNLTIVQGVLAVKDGDTSYFVPELLRYVNFIESLKDGVMVKLEGLAFTSPHNANIKRLQVSKLNIGGKDYDLARPFPSAFGPEVWYPKRPMNHHCW